MFNGYSNSTIGKYKVFKKDKYVGSLNYYGTEDKIYLDLNDFSKLMKARKDIYSVSMKINLSIGDKKLIISKNEVDYNGLEKIKISKPFIIRGSRYYVNLDIFTTYSFSKIFEKRFDIDPDKKMVFILDDINITSVKFFSYIEKTRITVYMSKPLNYDINLIGRNIILTVYGGVYIASKETIEINDSNVKNINILQEQNTIKVIIEVGEGFLNYEVFTLKDPDRIVVDVKGKSISIKERIDTDTITSEEITPSTQTTVIFPHKLKREGKKVVIIDPGHGGKDPGGKIIFGKSEKQINLEISRKLYELFSNDDRYNVIMTRDSDVFVPLYERSKIANDNKCDIFISIHSNAHKNKSEKGFEIYFLSEKATDPWAADVAEYENAAIEYEGGVFDYSGAALVLHSLARNEDINESSKLSAYITKEIAKNTPFNIRGIKQAAFYVLRWTYCPGVLVEVGFMTNKEDKKKLDDPKIQKKIAEAIYRGILEYDKQSK